MFAPKHTFASVAIRLAEGLESGTVVLPKRGNHGELSRSRTRAMSVWNSIERPRKLTWEVLSSLSDQQLTAFVKLNMANLTQDELKLLYEAIAARQRSDELNDVLDKIASTTPKD